MEERGVLCVQCRRRPAVPAWRPFCSERCKLFDLENWLDGRYRIPGQTDEPPRGGEPTDGET